MEKKSYVKPILDSENFVTNLYFAVCFQVECTVNGSDEIKQYNWDGSESNTHGEGGCGNPEKQYITITDNGTPTFKEIGSDQGSYLITRNIVWPTEIKNGASINWETHNTNDGRTWHHKGIIIQNDARPLHS